jgi:hypothetical protein
MGPCHSAGGQLLDSHHGSPGVIPVSPTNSYFTDCSTFINHPVISAFTIDMDSAIK